MKKFLKVLLFVISGLIILGIIISSINNRIGNCTVQGEIKGMGTGFALVTGGNYSYTHKYLKFIMVINDKFDFKVKLKEHGGGRMLTWNMLFKRKSGRPLWMRSKLIQFDLLPNEVITINGYLKKYSINYTVSGNEISSQKSKFISNNLHILEKETQLALIIDSLKFNNANKAVIDSFNKELYKIIQEYTNKKLEYVIKNPDSELSISFLACQHKDTIIKYLPTLDKKLISTNSGKKLQKRVDVYKQTEKGKLAPNIVDGNTFNLSDLKGKYVVLEFWGTWCGACVSGLPKMRDYYNKYNSKIEFVGIACKDKKSVWEKFIKQEGLQWTQLLNDPKTNDFTSQYNIDVFPTKIIIDKEGKIVDIFEGETNDFYEKLDYLYQQK